MTRVYLKVIFKFGQLGHSLSARQIGFYGIHRPRKTSSRRERTSNSSNSRRTLGGGVLSSFTDLLRSARGEKRRQFAGTICRESRERESSLPSVANERDRDSDSPSPDRKMENASADREVPAW